MSGTRVQHLQRRSGIFHFRMRVPDDIRSLVGLSEVNRSLRTHQKSRAKIFAAVCAAQMLDVFEMARSENLTRDEVRHLIARCFKGLSEQVEIDTGSRLPDWEREEQLYCSTEMVASYREQLATGEYSHEVRSIAGRALASRCLQLAQLSPDRQEDILDGAARALIERERFRQLRVTDRLAPFAPVDPLFIGRLPLVDHEAASAVGPTLGEAIDTYLKEKERTWTPKTLKGRQQKLSYLREHCGDQRRLSSITADDIRSFREAIKKLRRRHGRAPKQSFSEKQTESKGHRVSDSTVALIFVPTKAFFRWCLAEQGYLESNPAENVRVTVAKRPKGVPSRRPFTSVELIKLFSAPVFTGCQSPKRRFAPGTIVCRDAHYWIPILGYYLGARLGEIVQLHTIDVVPGEVPYISISEAGGGSVGSSDAKHVKSEAGVRKIPLHPDLIDLGFLDFVAERRRLRKGKRLFWEVKFGADGQASTVFSKWFSRLMKSVGLSDRTLVFHSLRHNAEDAFRNALQPQYVIDKVIGHHDGATSRLYGEGASLPVLYEAVKAMRHEVDLAALLGFRG